MKDTEYSSWREYIGIFLKHQVRRFTACALKRAKFTYRAASDGIGESDQHFEIPLTMKALMV